MLMAEHGPVVHDLTAPQQFYDQNHCVRLGAILGSHTIMEE